MQLGTAPGLKRGGIPSLLEGREVGAGSPNAVQRRLVLHCARWFGHLELGNPDVALWLCLWVKHRALCESTGSASCAGVGGGVVCVLNFPLAAFPAVWGMNVNLKLGDFQSSFLGLHMENLLSISSESTSEGRYWCRNDGFACWYQPLTHRAV